MSVAGSPAGKRRWAAAADRVVTVNEAFAERLTTEMWHAAAPIAIVPERRGAAGPDARRRPILREAAGARRERPDRRLPGPDSRPDLGLEAADEAIPRVPDAALVILGFGPWRPTLAAEARRDVHRGRRHVTLDAARPTRLARVGRLGRRLPDPAAAARRATSA